MKIKSFVIAAALLVSTSAFAESVVTNNFGSNWFVGVGGGINMVADGLYTGKLTTGTGFGIDANIGKWFTPEIGARIDYNGFQTKFDDATQKSHLIGISVLWDVLNTFGEYKPNRIVSIVPYLQADYVLANTRGAGIGAGIQFPVRLCNNFYIVPDAHFLFTNDGVFTGTTNTGYCGFLNATLGLQYRFGKRTDFVTAAAAVAPLAVAVAEAEAAKQEAEVALQAATTEKEEAVQAKEELKAENETLSNELATVAAQNAAIVENLMGTTSCVYFEIGQATLSAKELAHLDYIVKTKIGQCKNLTFTVAGNADKNTGSKARNNQLSKQRANYIVKLLTTKYGLCKDQFEVVVNGGNNIYKPIELNRAVLIDVK